MTDTNQNELTRNSDKSFVLRLTIKADEVSSTYQKIKNEVSQTVEVKGFRKGKAPADVIDQQLSPEKILEETAQKIIPEIYQQKIKEYDLKPIVQPQIKITNPPITSDKEWQIEIISCELPEVIINDYQEKISQANKDNQGKDKEVQVNQILQILSSVAKATLPSILLDTEVSYKLSKLVDQTNQAGLTIQTYLKNQNLSLEQYKKNLSDQVTREWTLNLSIDKIANERQIKVDHEEIDKEMKKYPDQKIDHNFLHFILLQNKTLEYLQTL